MDGAHQVMIQVLMITHIQLAITIMVQNQRKVVVLELLEEL
jgi:hypothetical protein